MAFIEWWVRSVEFACLQQAKFTKETKLQARFGLNEIG